MCHQFLCASPQTLEVPINPKTGRFDVESPVVKIDKFAIGNLAGIQMALDVCRLKSRGWFEEFQLHDRVSIECTGIVANYDPHQNDMPEFTIVVERD